MKYIIAYDIPDNNIRNKVSKLLESTGYRLQYSLFVADLEQTSLPTLKENLILISGKSKTNNISIIPICQNCYNKLWQIGNPKETHRNYVIA